MISVVWDDGVTECPDEYIAKCSEAFDHFDLPEEIYEQDEKRRAILGDLMAIYEPLKEHLRTRGHADS